MGQAPPGSSYNDSGEGYPLISGAGDFGEVNPAPKKFTTEATRISHTGDLVLGIRASIGAKVLADGEYCLGRGVAALRARDSIDERYLWHHITSSTRELVSKARGATFKQVNRADITDLPITLPPLEEQQRIAAILDKADELRTKRQEAIAKLDTLAQSIFIEMFGDPDESKKMWDDTTLADVCLDGAPIIYGILQPGPEIPEGVPYVRPTEILEDSIDLANIKRTSREIAARYKRSTLHEGDLLISIVGTLGKIAEIPKELDGGNITQSSARIRINKEVADTTYIRELLKTPICTRQYDRHRLGTGVPRLNIHHVRELEIPLPPLESQREFARRIRKLSKTRIQYSDSFDHFSSLFDSLHQRAFNGEL